MRAEDARRQALKGLADAKKSNEKSSGKDKMAIRDRIERAEEMLSSPDYCRVKINMYGRDFREFQAQADTACAAMLGRVTDAVASAVGPGDYDNILQRLDGWTEAKSSPQTLRTYIENNEGGSTIMTSAIKDNLVSLISQTVSDIGNFDMLNSGYYGTDTGTMKDIMERLSQITDAIKDTEIPNTQATMDQYKQIRAELDKVRDSVAKGYTYDIDTSLNRIAEKAEKLVELAKSGGLKDKAVKNPDFGEPYPNTGTIDINETDTSKLDELDSGVVIYKTFSQADSIINKMYDNAINIILGIKGLNEDAQLKAYQARGEKLNKQLKEAKTEAQKDVIRTQLRSIMTQMKNRQAYIAERVKKLTDYYAVIGQSYNEIAQYMDEMMSYFIPLPGQYKLTLQNYKKFLEKFEYLLNYSMQQGKIKFLSFGSKKSIKVGSIADIVKLYQTALAENDENTVKNIKLVVKESVAGLQGVTKDMFGRETSSKYKLLDKDPNKVDVNVQKQAEKTPEQLKAQEEEDAEFDFLFGDGSASGAAGGTSGGETEEPVTEEPVTEEPVTETDDEVPEEIKQILRELNG